MRYFFWRVYVYKSFKVYMDKIQHRFVNLNVFYSELHYVNDWK